MEFGLFGCDWMFLRLICELNYVELDFVYVMFCNFLNVDEFFVFNVCVCEVLFGIDCKY